MAVLSEKRGKKTHDPVSDEGRDGDGGPGPLDRRLGPGEVGGPGRDQGHEEPPVAKSDKAFAAARRIFETNCIFCHGSEGTGDGVAAGSLPIKPADWTSPATQAQADGEIYWKITNGRGPMPSWSHLSDDDRWSLVHFIRTFKK